MTTVARITYLPGKDPPNFGVNPLLNGDPDTGPALSPSVTVGYSQLQGRPAITVSPIGLSTPGVTLANNGADYGPDTPGTTTSGIQEAINSLPPSNGAAQTTAPYSSGGGTIYLLPGTFQCSSPISIPNAAVASGVNSAAYYLRIVGAGKTRSILLYTGAGDFITTAFNPTTPGFGGAPDYPDQNTLNLVLEHLAVIYQTGTNTANAINLGALNTLLMQDVAVGTSNGVSGDTGAPGYGLDYSNVPSQELGVTGLLLTHNSGNLVTLLHCSFFGLAVGIHSGADHLTVIACEFANIGAYGTTTPPSFGNLITSGVGQYGPAIWIDPSTVGNATLLNTQIAFSHFFNSYTAIADGSSGASAPNGSVPRVVGCYIEQCDWGILTVNNSPILIEGTMINSASSQGVVSLSTGTPTTAPANRTNVVWRNGLIGLSGFGQGIPQAITVGASPFTFTNSLNLGDLIVYVSGGAVTGITLGAVGSQVSTGLTSGAFRLRAGESITVTFTAAPTMLYDPA